MKPLDDPWRQGWTADRVDVVLDVSLVAGSEENDIDTLLVARVAIRGIGDALRGAVGDEEPERIALGKDRRVEMILRPRLAPPIIERLHTTFGHLTGVGLDRPGPVKK